MAGGNGICKTLTVTAVRWLLLTSFGARESLRAEEQHPGNAYRAINSYPPDRNRRTYGRRNGDEYFANERGTFRS